jgi:DNA polymerase-3 subunit alpha
VSAEFIHLHTHTTGSLLDGLTKVSELVDVVGSHGSKAVAITDHGSMANIPALWRESKRAGIKPIAGIEAYICRDRAVKDKTERYYHVTLLADSAYGYRNLCALSATAWTDGFYSKPRLDLDILANHAEGIICMSGCVGGWAAQRILEGDVRGATDVLGRMASVFEGRFYVEVQYTGEQDQLTANKGLIAIARKLHLPLAASGDSHYAKKEDADFHDTLFCIGIHAKKDDAARMKFVPEQYHVKSPQEMWRIGLPAEAYKNTVAIAERCEEYELPRSGGLPERSKDEDLESFAIEGLANRRPDASEVYWERLSHELSVIHSLGFENHFLIARDITRYADSCGVFHGWGRGSSAGSLVAYALGITNVDPLPLGLYFERFLNPARREPPDIDIDIRDDFRPSVIQHIEQTYGRDNVFSIATYGTLGPRQIVTDLAKVYGKDEAAAKIVIDALPHDPTTKVADILADESMMATIELTLGDEVAACIRKFEGMQRQAGTHAAGVIIDRSPLVGVLPVITGRDREKLASQYVYDDLKTLGFEKFDVLGVKALRVIQNVAETASVELKHVPLDDQKTYHLLSRGQCSGVFQLEGYGYQMFVREFKPKDFNDVMMISALYRPGPMKGGKGLDEVLARRFKRRPVQYAHPSLEETLKDTYGIMLYQEQVMRVVQILAGWTLAEADQLRWAIGKKKKEEIAKLRVKFEIDCGKLHGKDFAVKMFDEIEFFARYGWNKAHAAVYGMVTYVSAYLKANYPAIFMCEFLNSESGDYEKVNKLIRECNRLGIRILRPDINLSGYGFVVGGGGENSAIRTGLSSIKFVGEKAARLVLDEREKKRYSTLADFRARIPKKVLNSLALASLERAGAFKEIPKDGEEEVPF